MLCHALFQVMCRHIHQHIMLLSCHLRLWSCVSGVSYTFIMQAYIENRRTVFSDIDRGYRVHEHEYVNAAEELDKSLISEFIEGGRRPQVAPGPWAAGLLGRLTWGGSRCWGPHPPPSSSKRWNLTNPWTPSWTHNFTCGSSPPLFPQSRWEKKNKLFSSRQ